MPIVITQTCLIGGSVVVLAVVVVPVLVGELEDGVPVLPESLDGAPVEGAPDPPVDPACSRGGVVCNRSGCVDGRTTADAVHHQVQRQRCEADRPAPDQDTERQDPEHRRGRGARRRQLERWERKPRAVRPR